MGQAEPVPVAQEPEFYTDLPVGEVLRRTRLHYGQSLKDVEKNIRIRASQIEAIETGHYENLPGRVYAIGFVRSYAEYLGLDGGQVVSLFKAQSMNKTASPELHFPAPASESKLPSRWIIILSVIGTIFFTMFWWSSVHEGREQFKTVPPVPEELQARMNTPSEVATSSDTKMAGEFVYGPQLPTVEAVEEAAAPEVTQESVVAVEPVVETSQTSSVPAASVPAAPSGITLNISENSWVEIRDQSGQIIVSKVLKIGDQYFVPNRPDLRMDLGNAGGVEVTIDGKAVPPLGARGEVKRDISLDADKLRVSLENPSK